jgi:hypothetical protein
MLVAEGDTLVNEIAYGLYAAPTGRGISEKGPCKIEESIGVTKPAREKKY